MLYRSIYHDRANTFCICEGGESAVMMKNKLGTAKAVQYPVASDNTERDLGHHVRRLCAAFAQIV